MQLSSSVAELRCDEAMDPPAEDFQQVLSIDQIRSIRASNNYVERPAARFQQARSNPSLSQPPHKHECSVSQSTAASDQRLLSSLTPSHSGHSLIRTQPRAGELKLEESPLKGVSEKPALHAGHLFICEECGRCKCAR
ncbi:PREDICTED: protein sprouty homolog 3-like, partial [Pterocles gutturalis]|uniref:protein sprouty homolog 3-like n=1 Tax=Pterocles gutturalis TaxID=240206 RepID=UPI0005282A65